MLEMVEHPFEVPECVLDDTALAAWQGPVKRDTRARASTVTALGCLAARDHAARDTSARRCHVQIVVGLGVDDER